MKKTKDKNLLPSPASPLVDLPTRTYLTASELGKRIGYTERSIRDTLLDSVLIEGVHYLRPFGRRRILFIWEAVERDMFQASEDNEIAIPMSDGSVTKL